MLLLIILSFISCHTLNNENYKVLSYWAASLTNDQTFLSCTKEIHNHSRFTGLPPYQLLALKAAESVIRAEKYSDPAEQGYRDEGVHCPLFVSCVSEEAQPWHFQNIHKHLSRLGKLVKHKHTSSDIIFHSK